MSGLSRTPGKRVYVNSVSRVRIPSSLPMDCTLTPFWAFLFGLLKDNFQLNQINITFTFLLFFSIFSCGFQK